eukprot:2408033-Karenia_brevis.AAC.1
MVVDETYLCMTDVDALVDDIFNLDDDNADDTLSDPHCLPDSCLELASVLHQNTHVADELGQVDGRSTQDARITFDPWSETRHHHDSSFETGNQQQGTSSAS